MATGRRKIDPSLKRVKTGVSLSPQLMDDIDFLVLLTNTSRSAVLEAAAADLLRDIAGRLRVLNNRVKRNPDVPFSVSDPRVSAFIRQVHSVGRGATGAPFMLFSPGGGVDD